MSITVGKLIEYLKEKDPQLPIVLSTDPGRESDPYQALESFAVWTYHAGNCFPETYHEKVNGVFVQKTAPKGKKVLCLLHKGMAPIPQCGG